VISIRDTGAGIPEAVRSKIFDPFFTTKPIGQGTGLGLAISYGIVQDHGGSIEVRSEETMGAEFIVKIPLTLESRRVK
jgi:signal transduction histidine kinase